MGLKILFLLVITLRNLFLKPTLIKVKNITFALIS
jgi:hypothetical protein